VEYEHHRHRDDVCDALGNDSGTLIARELLFLEL